MKKIEIIKYGLEHKIIFKIASIESSVKQVSYYAHVKISIS
jgi:hypothetical protein